MRYSRGEGGGSLVVGSRGRRAEGYVAGHTITTVHYIVGREKGRRVAATAVTDLLRVVHLLPLGDTDFHKALVLSLGDFADAVQAAVALDFGADDLVIRNEQDFQGIPVPLRTVGSPHAALERTATPRSRSSEGKIPSPP